MRGRAARLIASPLFAGMVGLALTVPAFAAPEPFSLTLAPARAILSPGADSVRFLLYNGGTLPLRVDVRPQDGWLLPDEATFDLAPGARHETRAAVVVPARHDAGDHSSTLVFSVPASTTSTGSPLRVSRGLGATVVIPTGGAARHGLRFDLLRLPRFVDSTSGPVSVTVRAVNAGNVHEDVRLTGRADGFRPLDDITAQHHEALAFPPTTLLRDQGRELRTDWQPPLLCFCDVKVADLSASVVALPLKPLGALVGLLGLALVVSAVRRRRGQP